jgi:SAM-dependent methyltransferase
MAGRSARVVGGVAQSVTEASLPGANEVRAAEVAARLFEEGVLLTHFGPVNVRVAGAAERWDGKGGPKRVLEQIIGRRSVAVDRIAAMRQEEVWDVEAAQRYDTPGTGMFAPAVLGPTVDRLVELVGDGPALEFAIGTGRVAVPLSQRGVPVTGIELSGPMIEQLRTKADGETIPVIVGDMASAVAPGAFTLVYLVFNTISNLLEQSQQVACFRNAARHLTRGGRFVIELWVPELRKLPPGQQATVWHSEPGYVGLDTYDVLHQQVVSHHFHFGEGKEARLFRSPHRYVWPAELDLMAELAGFELESRHADWTGAEFTAESRSHVSVYRLRNGPPHV